MHKASNVFSNFAKPRYLINQWRFNSTCICHSKFKSIKFNRWYSSFGGTLTQEEHILAQTALVLSSPCSCDSSIWPHLKLRKTKQLLLIDEHYFVMVLNTRKLWFTTSRVLSFISVLDLIQYFTHCSLPLQLDVIICSLQLCWLQIQHVQSTCSFPNITDKIRC